MRGMEYMGEGGLGGRRGKEGRERRFGGWECFSVKYFKKGQFQIT